MPSRQVSSAKNNVVKTQCIKLQLTVHGAVEEVTKALAASQVKIAAKSLGLGGTIALGSALALGSTVTFSEPAHAWFQVCNRSTQSVSVAFAYLEIDALRPDIFGNSPPQIEGGWSSQGWWNLNPGACAQTYPHELRVRNNVYYVYAKGNRGSEWRGSHSFCTISEGFILGSADKVCGNGGEWKGFREVRTGNARNYTYNLTN